MKKISFLLFFILSFNFISSASSEDLNDYSPDFLCEALMIKDCKIDFYSFTPQYDRYLKSNWQHKIIVLNQNSMSRQFENPLFYFVTEQRDAHAAGWGYHEERTTLNNCKSKIKDAVNKQSIVEILLFFLIKYEKKIKPINEIKVMLKINST